jgi:hypothetical protein
MILGFGLWRGGLFKKDSQMVTGDDARIEARNLMLDARVSSFERGTSIRASTTIYAISKGEGAG